MCARRCPAPCRKHAAEWRRASPPSRCNVEELLSLSVEGGCCRLLQVLPLLLPLLVLRVLVRLTLLHLPLPPPPPLLLLRPLLLSDRCTATAERAFRTQLRARVPNAKSWVRAVSMVA